MPSAPAEAGGRVRRPTVAFLYSAGVVQGVAMVSFAASSAVLCSRHGFSDTEYGSIFLPNMALAVAGAIGSGPLLRVFDLRRLLVFSFAAMALSQAALARSHFLPPGAALATVALGAGLMGLGSGLGAAPLNTYPQLVFPGWSDSSVVAMHTAMGIGLAGGPLLVGAAVLGGLWLLFPLASLGACLALLLLTLEVALPRPLAPSAGGGPGAPPTGAPAFWLFFGAALLYGMAEAAYSNWAVLYLSGEKRLGAGAASLGLAAFWSALSAGRVLAGLLVLRVSAERVYVVLPLLMAGASLLLPWAETPGRAVFFFALAGLGCSAFYPLTVGLGSRRFPGHMASVSAILFAALITGIGGGSFLTGALRAHLTLASIYRLYALGPLVALLLVLGALAPPRPAASRRSVAG